MSKELEIINKIKDYVFSKEHRVVCDCCYFCGLKDGYCPTYECRGLDKLKEYTDRQWLNAIRETRNLYGDNISFEDLVDEVLCELFYKRPRGEQR